MLLNVLGFFVEKEGKKVSIYKYYVLVKNIYIYINIMFLSKITVCNLYYISALDMFPTSATYLNAVQSNIKTIGRLAGQFTTYFTGINLGWWYCHPH